jgi:hypothetical protein
VRSWREMVVVTAGYLRIIALRGDGRVLATGDRTTGACDVGERGRRRPL